MFMMWPITVPNMNNIHKLWNKINAKGQTDQKMDEETHGADHDDNTLLPKGACLKSTYI